MQREGRSTTGGTSHAFCDRKSRPVSDCSNPKFSKSAYVLHGSDVTITVSDLAATSEMSYFLNIIRPIHVTFMLLATVP